MMRGWRSSSFAFVRSSVTPAIALNSPPDNVVGTLICRIVGGFMGRANGTVGSLHRAQPVDRLGCADIVGKAHLHGFGGVGDGAPTDRDDEVGLCSPRRLSCLDHGRPRRMRRHPVEGRSAPIAKPASDPVNLVCVSIEGVTHHQEDARRPEALHLVSYRLGGCLAEYEPHPYRRRRCGPIATCIPPTDLPCSWHPHFVRCALEGQVAFPIVTPQKMEATYEVASRWEDVMTRDVAI